VVAWSFYSPDAARAAADLAWLPAHAAAALHVAGGVHATAEPAATVRAGFDVVIAGEGEAAFVELVAAIRAGRAPRGGPGTHWAGGSGPAAPRRPATADGHDCRVGSLSWSVAPRPRIGKRARTARCPPLLHDAARTVMRGNCADADS